MPDQAKYFLISCVFILTALGGPAASHNITAEEADEECASYPDVPVNVTTVFDEPVYNYAINVQSLQGLASDVTHTVHGPHRGITLGLTRYEPVLKFNVPIRGVELASGLSCAHVEHVDVLIGYKNVTVYVPEEIQAGTCGFDQVMAHEQKHIDVNRQVLAKYKPLIEDKLKEYLRLNGVFKEENADYALSLLKEHLQAILNDLAEQMTSENRELQEQVDSPEEYARVGASCGGQLRNTATQYMRQSR